MCGVGAEKELCRCPGKLQALHVYVCVGVDPWEPVVCGVL